jgi:hypothetical protein
MIDPLTPTNLIAGTEYRGIYTSLNGGASWKFNDDDILGGIGCSGLAMDPKNPEILYAAAFDGRIYKSPDRGMYWELIHSGVLADPNCPFIGALAINLDTPTTLFAISECSGMLKSTDGGVNWITLSFGRHRHSLLAFAMNAADPNILYVWKHDDGLYKTIDGGMSWDLIFSGLADKIITGLVINPAAPNIMYASTREEGVFRSVDGGDTWVAINKGINSTWIQALAIDPREPEILYAGAKNYFDIFPGGVFRSLDGGDTWKAINNGLYSLDINVLVVDPLTPGVVYAGTNGGGVFVLK